MSLLDQLMVTATTISNNGYVWIALTILLLVFKSTRKIGFACVLSLIVAVIAQDVLKELFQRPRPPVVPGMLIERPDSYAFPSGHSLISFSVAATLYLFRSRLAIPAVILAFLVAISRVYLGVHYVSDIVFGALFGVAISVLIKFLLTRWETRRAKGELEV
jgi:undecaprenyl-diphosphatase